MSRVPNWAWGTAALVGAASFLLYANWRRARWARSAPGWLDPEQPPDGVAAELSTLTPDQSWAANRCRHMSACSADRTAGARIRRVYPGRLSIFGSGDLETELM